MLESGFYNMDCMDAMKQFPDKFFDLAIVDPPYGGGASEPTVNGMLSGGGANWEHKARGRFGQRFDRYHIGGPHRRELVCEVSPSTEGGGDDITHWDIAPPPEYFRELARVSREQIIWGGNYFDLPPTRCFVVWDKQQHESFSMAMCEYAWTSFNLNAKIFRHKANGLPGERFHPTQKPVALYTWLLKMYAKQGMKILDTHVGSASSLVACHRAGLEYWGFEIDPVYYEKAKARLDRETAQLRMEL